jgi:hypothetical protein
MTTETTTRLRNIGGRVFGWSNLDRISGPENVSDMLKKIRGHIDPLAHAQQLTTGSVENDLEELTSHLL